MARYNLGLCHILRAIKDDICALGRFQFFFRLLFLFKNSVGVALSIHDLEVSFLLLFYPLPIPSFSVTLCTQLVDFVYRTVNATKHEQEMKQKNTVLNVSDSNYRPI